MKIVGYVFAALLAVLLGNARAAPMLVDGEQCVVPSADYVHVGALASGRYFWLWCATRWNVHWAVSLDPLARTPELRIVVGSPAEQSKRVFTADGPATKFGDPATADLEAAARAAVTADAHRPPVPQWAVQKNGTATTRPGYVISDGKRSTTAAAERVPVSVPCDCRAKIGRAVEGKSVYCVVPGTQTPLLGALCSSAPVTP